MQQFLYHLLHKHSTDVSYCCCDFIICHATDFKEHLSMCEALCWEQRGTMFGLK